MLRRRLIDTEILIELTFEALARVSISRIQQLCPIAFKMALESAGKALRTDHKHLRIRIVSHSLAVWRLAKTDAATSPRGKGRTRKFECALVKSRS